MSVKISKFVVVTVLCCVQHSCGWEQTPMADSCEHCDDSSTVVKGERFIDYLMERCLHKEGSFFRRDAHFVNR